MLSDLQSARITEIFDMQLGLIDKTEHPDVLKFFETTNYYLLMRGDHLTTVYNTISNSEAVYSLLFDSMPRILFEFSSEQLEALINRLTESFLFWKDPVNNTIPYTTELNRVEETLYEAAFLKEKFLNEKWIIILCLFFLLFYRTEHFKKYVRIFEQTGTSKTSK